MNIPGAKRHRSLCGGHGKCRGQGTITASADTGTTALPVIVNLCETNPVTGQCVSAIGPIVVTQIDASETPTFGSSSRATAMCRLIRQGTGFLCDSKTAAE